MDENVKPLEKVYYVVVNENEDITFRTMTAYYRRSSPPRLYSSIGHAKNALANRIYKEKSQNWKIQAIRLQKII